jgi:hypothetical protein
MTKEYVSIINCDHHSVLLSRSRVYIRCPHCQITWVNNLSYANTYDFLIFDQSYTEIKLFHRLFKGIFYEDIISHVWRIDPDNTIITVMDFLYLPLWKDSLDYLVMQKDFRKYVRRLGTY